MSDQVEIPDISDLPDMQEAAEFTPVVKLLTTETPVLGYDGANINPANWQAKALADRTQWLRDRLLNLSTRLVMSVNGKTGNVVVTYADAGADAAGTADALMTAHLTALDPHSQYFDETRGDSRYVQRSLANQSNGWLQLDASGKIPASMLTLLASRYVVEANQAARLALASSANLTICAQADINQLFYLNGGSNPAVAANWVAGQSATVSGVSSVFGRTGALTAQNGDYDADKITETATRKFASPAEKTAWNAKQAVLVSGTNIRSLFGNSLLGSGNLTPTPAQMGSAATVHTHTTADITDYTQKTQQLITASLEAGTGVTLGYNPINGKTIISASGGADGGGGYIVIDRLGSTAGQNHSFSISMQNKFNLFAYALKEVSGATSQAQLIDDFNPASEYNYTNTNHILFDGFLKLRTKDYAELTAYGSFFSKPIDVDVKMINLTIAGAAISIVPTMTSNTSPAGYVASASSEYPGSGYQAWNAFTASNNYWCSRLPMGQSGDNPEWLMIRFPSKMGIYNYSIKATSGYGNESWNLQGSNDEGATWVDIHIVENQVSTEAIQNFTVTNPGDYSLIRVYIRKTKNRSYATIAKLDILEKNKYFIIQSGGKNYTVKNGQIVQIADELSSDLINDFGASSTGNVPLSNSRITNPATLISDSPIGIDIKTSPFSQISIQQRIKPLSSISQINSATLTATQTGNGKVRVAVTRDLVSWHVFRGGAWIDVGALSADTAGAEALIADGMTPAEIGAITAAQWAQLFSPNNGVPDAIAFAFALDITDPVIDSAMIDRLMLNVNEASSWKLQTAAEVEIRWWNNNVSFKTVAAGNYKLAYQIP
ncbi:carbohydrate-binding protein [Pectobacterium sp. A113-S21-F16]|uniref:carbohydrate-binding protein n=1 Tax=Pectobacterium quasiaquaticum TaxID=2774015 RepID=UPI001875C6B9|nr:carbohydrate-binding protein [Pectobacterium quasiaquaticum]MBE5221589.1 carbohydrate-binding protein [Pectobacterium quasiaquaticum]